MLSYLFLESSKIGLMDPVFVEEHQHGSTIEIEEDLRVDKLFYLGLTKGNAVWFIIYDNQTIDIVQLNTNDKLIMVKNIELVSFYNPHQEDQLDKSLDNRILVHIYLSILFDYQVLNNRYKKYYLEDITRSKLLDEKFIIKVVINELPLKINFERYGFNIYIKSPVASCRGNIFAFSGVLIKKLYGVNNDGQPQQE